MPAFGTGDASLNWLAHVGFGCLALSYMTKDMLHLRVCLCVSNVLLVAWGYFALSDQASIAAVGWNSLFFIVNAWRAMQEVQAKSRPSSNGPVSHNKVVEQLGKV